MLRCGIEVQGGIKRGQEMYLPEDLIRNNGAIFMELGSLIKVQVF